MFGYSISGIRMGVGSESLWESSVFPSDATDSVEIGMSIPARVSIRGDR
jgi:hypothetical protein